MPKRLLQVALDELRCAMKAQGLWCDVMPSAAALGSAQPFCIDTLTFPQWLQFVFIARMQALLDAHGELPSNCDIAPMAEEYFKGSVVPGADIVACLARIDKLLSA